MLVHRASLFRLEPTEQQAAAFARWCGACRFVYNAALEQRRDHWRKAQLSFAQQCRELTKARSEIGWLADVPVHALQQALYDLDVSYKRFFARVAGYPRMRQKDRNDSFRLPDPSYLGFKRLSKRIGSVKIPKLGWVKCRGWRPLGGLIRSITIKRKAGHWYAAIQWSSDVVVDAEGASKRPSVGIDRGIKVFAALSSGALISPISSLREISHKIAKLQSALARKQRLSSNWRRHKLKINRLHAHAAAIRKDFLHKLSTNIAKNHSDVKIERLHVQKMSAAANGSNVAQKRGLNRSILEQGWSMFAGMLRYKLAESGGTLIEVSAAYTSQMCSVCGITDETNRRTQAMFKCVACGHTDHADTNAAKNISAGRALPPKPPKRVPSGTGKRKQSIKTSQEC